MSHLASKSRPKPQSPLIALCNSAYDIQDNEYKALSDPKEEYPPGREGYTADRDTLRAVLHNRRPLQTRLTDQATEAFRYCLRNGYDAGRARERIASLVAACKELQQFGFQEALDVYFDTGYGPKIGRAMEEIRFMNEEIEARPEKRRRQKADVAGQTQVEQAEGVALPPVAPTEAPGNGPRIVRHIASVNARMLETIQDNPEAMGWSSPKWAKHLQCAKSSVVDTPTWKDLAMRRDRERAERAKDRRRRNKGSDRRGD